MTTAPLLPAFSITAHVISITNNTAALSFHAIGPGYGTTANPATPASFVQDPNNPGTFFLAATDPQAGEGREGVFSVPLTPGQGTVTVSVTVLEGTSAGLEKELVFTGIPSGGTSVSAVGTL